MADLRRDLVGDLRGQVLELGVGTGLNFDHYPPAVELTGSEPDPHMLRRARKHAAQVRPETRLIEAPAERLPFPDASFDAVVSTLVLCSVAQPEQVAREVRRVLKPGGEFRFLEHVLADQPRLSAWQHRIQPLWSWFVGGCHPDRDTVETLKRAGFAVESRAFGFGPLPIVRPHVIGRAALPD